MHNLQSLFRNFPLLTYKKGEVIVSQGEVPRSAFYIQSGLIKTYNLTVGGQERLIDINTANDIFPDTWIFGKSGGAIYFYEALENSTVYAIPRQTFVELMHAKPMLQHALLDRYVGTTITQYMRINALTHAMASEKLLHMLRYLSMRFGKLVGAKQQIELQIHLNHTLLADLMGISRETATNELIKLKKRGVISYDRKKMTINLAKLYDAIGDTDYNELILKQKKDV